MSWGAQSRSKDAKTPSAALVMSEKPELDLRPSNIVRDGQWQCGANKAYPARRVMPNGPVGRKLQHFKCMSKVACCACVPNGWCPFGHNIGGF
jgi:hypothetical protein